MKKQIRCFVEAIQPVTNSIRFHGRPYLPDDPQIEKGLLCYRETGFPKRLSKEIEGLICNDGTQELHSFVLLSGIQRLYEWYREQNFNPENCEKILRLTKHMGRVLEEKNGEPRLIFWREEARK